MGLHKRMETTTTTELNKRNVLDPSSHLVNRPALAVLNINTVGLRSPVPFFKLLFFFFFWYVKENCMYVCVGLVFFLIRCRGAWTTSTRCAQLCVCVYKYKGTWQGWGKRGRVRLCTTTTTTTTSCTVRVYINTFTCTTDTDRESKKRRDGM